MSIIKLITIIVAFWLILKIKRLISGVHIKSGKSDVYKEKKSRKAGMDIQDAEYEDVE